MLKTIKKFWKSENPFGKITVIAGGAMSFHILLLGIPLYYGTPVTIPIFLDIAAWSFLFVVLRKSYLKMEEMKEELEEKMKVEVALGEKLQAQLDDVRGKSPEDFIDELRKSAENHFGKGNVHIHGLTSDDLEGSGLPDDMPEALKDMIKKSLMEHLTGEAEDVLKKVKNMDYEEFNLLLDHAPSESDIVELIEIMEKRDDLDDKVKISKAFLKNLKREK